MGVNRREERALDGAGRELFSLWAVKVAGSSQQAHSSTDLEAAHL